MCSRGLLYYLSTNSARKDSYHGILKLRLGVYDNKTYLAVFEFSGTVRVFPPAFVFRPMASVFVLVDAVKATAASVCRAWKGAFKENPGPARSTIGASLH